MIGGYSYIQLAPYSKFKVTDKSLISYGTDIKLYDGASLLLEGVFINADVRIRCYESIRIGKRTVISYDVAIMDSDEHKVIAENYRNTVPINISEHVWCGNGAIILKGVTIGDGAIVAAGSIVIRDVPAHTLVAGCPAVVKKTGVVWED